MLINGDDFIGAILTVDFANRAFEEVGLGFGLQIVQESGRRKTGTDEQNLSAQFHRFTHGRICRRRRLGFAVSGNTVFSFCADSSPGVGSVFASDRTREFFKQNLGDFSGPDLRKVFGIMGTVIPASVQTAQINVRTGERGEECRSALTDGITDTVDDTFSSVLKVTALGNGRMNQKNIIFFDSQFFQSICQHVRGESRAFDRFNVTVIGKIVECAQILFDVAVGNGGLTFSFSLHNDLFQIFFAVQT